MSFKNSGAAFSLKVCNMAPEKGRWLLVAIGAVIFFFIGTIYSWSVFRSPLQSYFACGATAAGAPYMLFFAVQAFFMPFIGPYIDRLDPAKVVWISGAIMSAGLIAASYARSIYEFSAAFGFVFGLGATAVYAVPIAVASKWFPDKKGFAIGLTLFGMGLAPLIMAPAAVEAIAYFGILKTFRVIGYIIFIVVIVLAGPIKFPPSGYFSSNACVDNGIPFGLKGSDTIAFLFKSRAFYALWFCFMISSASGLMLIGITYQIAVETYKLDAVQAAFAVSVFAFFNAAGRPVWGMVIDCVNSRAAAALSFVIIGISAAALAAGPVEILYIFYFAVPAIWFCYGGWLSIAPSLTADFFGAGDSSRNYGVVFTAFGAGALIGNLAAGFSKDLYGNFIPALYSITAGAVLAIIIITAALKKPDFNNF